LSRVLRFVESRGDVIIAFWESFEPREWELTPAVAERLKRVRVELHYLIPCLFQAQAFFRLFGVANSPRILEFVPNGVKVVD
jgi:hypothetical protein